MRKVRPPSHTEQLKCCKGRCLHMDEFASVHTDMSIILLKSLWDKLSAKLFIIIKMILKGNQESQVFQNTSCVLWHHFMLFWFSLLKLTSYPNCTAFEITCPGWAGIPGKFQHDLLLGVRAPFCLNKWTEKYQESHSEFPVIENNLQHICGV